MLSEQEIGKAYAQTLRAISMSRGMISDQTRQHMAAAVREFHDLLEARIEAKRTPLRAVVQASASEKETRAKF